MKTVLVIGAGGFFGRILCEEMLQFCDAHLILSGRNLPRLETLRQTWRQDWQERTRCLGVDLHEASSLESLMPQCRVAICAAGPFQQMPHSLLRACLAHNVHYIDLCDDRSFVLAALEIARQSPKPVAVASGWSAVPALSALLANSAAQGMEKIQRIRIQIAPGNRAPRSAATVASLLDSVGKPLRMWRNDQWQEVTGWSELMAFTFPLPVGSRSGTLVDVPDLEIFPALFGASCVEFRVGAELMLLNHATSVLAQLAKLGIVGSFRPWAKPMHAAMSLFGGAGHDCGALGVECDGLAGGQVLTRKVSIVADHNGHHIPVMPAVILCRQLLAGDREIVGVPPWRTWLNAEELQRECLERGYRLVVH